MTGTKKAAPRKTTRGQGEGTVRQRTDGRWEAMLTVGTDPTTGKQKRRSVYGKTRAEAAQKLAALQVEHHKGVAVQNGTIPLITYLTTFARGRVPFIRPSTQRNHDLYLRTIATHRVAKMNISDIRARHAEQMYIDLARHYSDSVVSHIRAFVNQGLRDALKNELIASASALEAAMPKRPKEVKARALTPQEVHRLLDELKNNRLRYLVRTILLTGMRIGEAQGITWDDYDPVARTLRIERTLTRIGARIQSGPTKTRAGRRTLYVSDELADLLTEWRAVLEGEAALNPNYRVNTLMFPNTHGREGDYNMVRRDFSIVAKRAGVMPLRLHDLRHTFATRLTLSGVDPRTVAALLGHTDARMTLAIYTHAQVETSKGAMLALNYDTK